MAEWGLRVRDHVGRITLDPEDRITRILGSVSTGNHNGSLSDPELLSGDAFAFAVPELDQKGAYINLDITIEGSKLAWTFEWEGDRKPYIIHYGVY